MIIEPVSLQNPARHVQTTVRGYLDVPSGSTVVAVIVAAVGDPGRSGQFRTAVWDGHQHTTAGRLPYLTSGGTGGSPG